MSKLKPGANPFYVLVLVAGVALLITACAYGVLTVKGSRASTAADAPLDHPLLAFLARHGGMLLAGEIAALFLAVVLAIGTDRIWIGRAARRGVRALPPNGEGHDVSRQ